MDKDAMIIPCEVFTRVCGFFRPVNQFNPGKREEYAERKSFIITGVLKKNDEENRISSINI